eukprot:COSAG01_NODE_37958_length_496_cov_1.801008_1_plen_37_part_10
MLMQRRQKATDAQQGTEGRTVDTVSSAMAASDQAVAL